MNSHAIGRGTIFGVDVNPVEGHIVVAWTDVFHASSDDVELLSKYIHLCSEDLFPRRPTPG